VLLAEVMRADNSLMDCEFDRVKETIRRYYTTKAEQEEAFKQYEIIHTKPIYNLKKICKDIQQHYIYLEKAEIIMELLALAYSDNNLCENENCIISQIVKELGIDANQYKSIYSIFSKKYQKGFYRTENSQKNSSSTNNDQSNRNKRSNNSTGSKSNNSKKVKHQHSYISVSEAYDILGVSGDFSDVEIKKAYRALAIKYHPDNAANLGDEAIRQATESMKQINEAWKTVKMARGIK
jgi:DnaJ-domain-containing protein 1